MEITFPPFPTHGLLDRPATEADIAEGRAAFVLRDSSGDLVGSPVQMGLPRLGYHVGNGERKLGVAVQIEAAGDDVLVGISHGDGTFSVCSAREFDAAPRFLVYFADGKFGLDQATTLLENEGFTTVRQRNVLATRRGKGPVFFIRHARGEVVSKEIALVSEASQSLAKCDCILEVSFLDLEEPLDESDSLCEIQWALEKAIHGFLHLEWNGDLSEFGI